MSSEAKLRNDIFKRTSEYDKQLCQNEQHEEARDVQMKEEEEEKEEVKEEEKEEDKEEDKEDDVESKKRNEECEKRREEKVILRILRRSQVVV